MSEVKYISNEGAKKLIKENKDLLILDVRKSNEYKTEKIVNAKNIPVEELEWEVEDLREYEDKPILVYCNSGNKSSVASELLVNEGFNQIYNLTTGILGYDGEKE